LAASRDGSGAECLSHCSPQRGAVPAAPAATFPAWRKMESAAALARLRRRVRKRQLPCRPRKFCLDSGECSRSLCGGQPAPPRACWGVTGTRITQHAAQPTRAVCNLLCVHFFVFLLPLKGGTQTFWEGVKPLEFTERRAFKWEIETHFECFSV